MMKKTTINLGIWMAVLSALFAILWFITFNMQDFFQPVPGWKDLEAYAREYNISRLILIYASLLLAVSYIILLVCLHRTVKEEERLWTLLALSFGIIYSVMATINYNIQAVSVRASLAAGETGGIEMFLPDNDNSIFNALANSYVYMSLSMFFAGFLFRGGRLEKWLKALLVIQIISAIGQVRYTMFDLNETIFIVTSMVWVAGAPAAFILMAFWFRKQQQSAP